MGRVLQKKKNRSSSSKAKPKRKLLKNGKKKINVLGNAIIAENWDKRLTLTQNYRRLGLVHRLNASSGGREKRSAAEAREDEHLDTLHINGSAKATTKLGLKETRVERDPETGKILRVIRDDHDDDEIEVAGRKIRRSNPLNDPLNDLSDNDDDVVDASSSRHADSAIVRQLEQQANKEGQAVKNKKPRHQSQREEEWITSLIEKHGDNVGAMARDRKLNPMQQSEGDLRRRIRKWQQNHSS